MPLERRLRHAFGHRGNVDLVWHLGVHGVDTTVEIKSRVAAWTAYYRAERPVRSC